MTYAAIGVGMATLCLIAGTAGFATFLHQWLFYLGLFAAIFPALELSADLFVNERENLGFLFLAGVSARELFGGKILSAFLVSSANLLAIMPCLAVPFLTGGISLSLFICTAVCLPNLLVFTLSLISFASALWAQESTAKLWAIVTGVVLCGAPLLLYAITLWSTNPLLHKFRIVSPAWAPWMVYSQFSPNSSNEFWISSAVTLAWSLLFFGLTGFALRWSWKRELSGADPGSWTARIDKWMRGDSRWRQKKAYWLDKNPYVWIALCDRQPVRMAWITLLLILGGATLCGALMPSAWLKEWMLFLVALILNSSIEWILAYTAAKRMGDERRSSALELLLTTPLEVPDLLRGQLMALELQFQPIFRTALLINICLMLGGLFIRTWTTTALWDNFVVWGLILFWTAIRALFKYSKISIKPMWAGFNTGLPLLSVARSMGFQRFWFFNLYNFYNLIATAGKFPSGSWLEVSLVSLITFVVVCIICFYHFHPEDTSEFKIEKMLLNEFRLIAAEPMPDPSDPRLKNWNLSEQLYRRRY